MLNSIVYRPILDIFVILLIIISCCSLALLIIPIFVLVESYLKILTIQTHVSVSPYEISLSQPCNVAALTSIMMINDGEGDPATSSWSTTDPLHLARIVTSANMDLFSGFQIWAITSFDDIIQPNYMPMCCANGPPHGLWELLQLGLFQTIS